MKKLLLILAILAIVSCAFTGVDDNQIKYTMDIKKVVELASAIEYEQDDEKGDVSLEEYINDKWEEFLKESGGAYKIDEQVDRAIIEIRRNLEDAGMSILSHTVKESNFVYKGTITFNEKISNIPNEVFCWMPITNIELPSSVINIGREAFSGTFLTEVVLPPRLTKIDQFAFYECEHLKSVIMPSSVSIIGKRAFEECKSLENIDISNVKEIGQDAFEGCEKLF